MVFIILKGGFMPISQVRFQLGQTVATPGALDALQAEGLDASVLLTRHVTVILVT